MKKIFIYEKKISKESIYFYISLFFGLIALKLNIKLKEE